ncbi:MAG: YidC/Oxa1 family membrane protein insertase [Clostridia bacterium]|nr:YidC/Oxa1 family membrane protein insertase [Clostridia bacterium]
MNEFLYGILQWINGWIGNYGWSMVVFTILVRLVLTPFDIKSRVSMRKTTKIQPELQRLQAKYANDKEKLNRKMSELYKKEHINPLSSCLPLLLTWPILIAVFTAMRMVSNGMLLGQVTEILEGKTPTMEPFLWIKNLWMPDSLFSPAYPDLGSLKQITGDLWLKWYNGQPIGSHMITTTDVPALLQNVGLELTADSFSNANLQAAIEAIQKAMAEVNPAYVDGIAGSARWTFNLLITKLTVMNNFNGLMLLPILSAVTQITMTKIMNGNQPQQPQQQNGAAGSGKFMTWFFPIFSLIICFGYSSAFALYWVAGNLVSMVQTYIINKVLDTKEQKAGTVAAEGTVK